MQRYVPRLIPAGTAPPDALVEPLIANPPPSPLGEHELIPHVAWMVEQDGEFVHVPSSDRGELDLMRGLSQITMLDGERRCRCRWHACLRRARAARAR